MALHNASAIPGRIGLRALGRKGEGRIIVFHADAEDFLGSAAGREPREQQREGGTQPEERAE